MTEDNLKELIKMQKKKYEIISKAEELQKVIDIIEALKLVKDKYIKAFEELGTEAKKGEDNGR